MSYNTIISTNQEIGKTIASEKFLNTMDGFWFSLNPNVIINSFDFVTVDNLFDSKTIGIVKELQAVTEHDHYNYISNYDTSNIKEQSNLETNGNEKKGRESEEKGEISQRHSNGVILAKVAIMANTGVKVEGYKEQLSINFPVGAFKTVR